MTRRSPQARPKERGRSDVWKLERENTKILRTEDKIMTETRSGNEYMVERRQK